MNAPVETRCGNLDEPAIEGQLKYQDFVCADKTSHQTRFTEDVGTHKSIDDIHHPNLSQPLAKPFDRSELEALLDKWCGAATVSREGTLAEFAA